MYWNILIYSSILLYSETCCDESVNKTCLMIVEDIHNVMKDNFNISYSGQVGKEGGDQEIE